jgi:hypothetical protein
MFPTDDELKQALSRKQPAADFTERLMWRVRAEPKVRRFPLKRWTVVGAVAASLTLGFYVRQQRRAEPAAASAEAEMNAEQLVDALAFAGSKLNVAREAVFEPQPEETQ